MLGLKGHRACDRLDYRRPVIRNKPRRYMNLNTALMSHL